MSTTVDQYRYEQKKINHVFHYTSDFTDLQKIIRHGFVPSYCKESIASRNYLTPMVSFCNIPIAEVDKYMRYGKNGIGMSLKWAIKNGISPVIYTHSNSPYHVILNSLSIMKLQFDLDEVFEGKKYNFLEIDPNDDFALDKMSLAYKINLKILQFLKNWETIYNEEKIITYQEREWRFVPYDKKILPLIEEGRIEYHDYSNKEIKPKPHLTEHPLEINNLEDIKYIVVTTDLQRRKVLKTLNSRFTEEITKDALLTGKLSILTASQIRNDF